MLRGFRIGVTSDRRSSDLITALERRGAKVLHAPALMIAPNDSDGTLLAETVAMIDARPEVVLVTTGYGMRRWFEVADAAGLGAQLTDVLEQARIYARGPKAHGQIRAAGLLDARTTGLDTTASLVDAMIADGLTGRRVAIQLHGYTDELQLARLHDVSAEVFAVTPYRWVQPATHDRLTKLIGAACQLQLDAITFTSAPAAEATLATARNLGVLPSFVHALAERLTTAAVGPVTAGPLRDHGINPSVPDRYRLGSLIRLVSEELVEHHVQRFRSGEVTIELRGRVVTVDGRLITLGPNALALFTKLAQSPTVVLRSELSQVLPEPLDDHALEVAVSRLRRSLGVPDLITTVVKRGYRLNARPVRD